MRKGHVQKNHIKIQIANRHMNIDFNLIKNQRMQMMQDNINRNFD